MVYLPIFDLIVANLSRLRNLLQATPYLPSENPAQTEIVIRYEIY